MMTPRDQKDKIPNLITRRSNSNNNNNTNNNSNQLKSRSRETQRQDRTLYSNAPYSSNNDNNNNRTSDTNNTSNEAWRKQPKPGCVEIKLLVSKSTLH